MQGALLTAPLFLHLRRSELSNQICNRTNGSSGEALFSHRQIGQGRVMPEDRHHKPSPGSAARHWRTETPKEGDKGLAAKSRHPRGRDIRMREVVRTEEQVARSVLGVHCTMGRSRNEVVTPSAMRRAWYGLGRHCYQVMTCAKGSAVSSFSRS